MVHYVICDSNVSFDPVLLCLEKQMQRKEMERNDRRVKRQITEETLPTMGIKGWILDLHIELCIVAI